MELYIANCTRQVQDFVFRLPGQLQLSKTEIKIGSQVKFDLPREAIDDIVKQHARFGMIESGEIDRTLPFAGLAYCIGKPLSVDKIRRGIDRNIEVLQADGVKLRREAAVAIESQIGDGDQPAMQVEVSVVEDTKNKPSEINERIVVDRTAPADGGDARYRGRRAAKSRGGRVS